MRKVASDRDNVVIEARREEAEEADRLAAPEPAAPADDIVGGDVFDTVITDDESRE
jgi:DNA-directed RNA polymerase subunit beta'